MIKIPSAESLLLATPNDILEDIVARIIIEANIHRLHSVSVTGSQFSNNNTLIKTLKEKGYDVTAYSDSLLIKWD